MKKILLLLICFAFLSFKSEPSIYKIESQIVTTIKGTTSWDVDYYIIEQDGKYYFSNTRVVNLDTKPIHLYKTETTFVAFLDNSTSVTFVVKQGRRI